MAGKPIATVGSMHVCPMVTGYIPHMGGPVSGPGAPNVLINGKPVALMAICVYVWVLPTRSRKASPQFLSMEHLWLQWAA
ncbi:PAAR domain-containing protein [Saccharicrinis fermentans]|uniref:PAAR domain-containing protein n=1 Tax=Saccharicrinis fermentans TaxID=982 RepID=UPI001FD62E35|nr:PAAR domain-containing protein [Saccharicrinis fermentans]